MKISLLSFRSIIFKYSLVFILVAQIRYFTDCADHPGDSEGAVGGAIGGIGEILTKQRSVPKVHDLDIGDPSKTELYVHYKDGNYETFCSKAGNSFKKIIKTKKNVHKLIWEAKNDKNCEFVRILKRENGYKYMLIIVTGGSFRLLRKLPNGKTWQDITYTRKNFSTFKFFFFDDGKFKEFEPSRDLVSVYKFSVGYQFRSGINCHKIQLGDKVLYDYELDPEFGLLKGVYLDLLTNDFNILSRNDITKELNIEKAESIQTSVPVRYSNLPRELKLIGYEPVDPFDPFNPDNFSEICHTKYTVTRAGLDYEYDLTSVRCVTIKCGDDIIWNKPHDSDTHPLFMKLLKVEKRILLRFSDHFVYFIHIGTVWRPQKFLYKESEGLKEIHEAVASITITEEQLNALSKCKKVNVDITKCENDTEFDRSFDDETGNGMLVARFGFVFNLIVSGKEKIWEADKGEYCKKIMVQSFDKKKCKYVTIFNVDGTIKHYKKIGDQWKTGGDSLIFYIQESSPSYTYSCEREGETLIFTTKLNYRFFMVKDEEEKIWQSRNRNESGIKIITNNNPSKERTNVSIYLSNGTIKHFEKRENTWVAMSNKAVLDLSIKKNDFHFICIVEGSCKSYFPNQNFKINKVIKGNLDIWTTQPNDQAVKAVLNGSGKEEKYLCILLESRNFVLLHKSGKNQPWEDITDTRHDLSQFQLFKWDGTEIKNPYYEVELSNTTYSYIFKENTNIGSIKYRNREIWFYGSGSGVEYPHRLNLELTKNKLSLTFDLNIERKLHVT
ncbi:hypothetical protein TpMuguga_03g00865 [Theileria parva strain Muguga]|uniref:Uncharacterized protein n=1 Tax=Theileria parva TaxID=5875 RepID=Q4MYH5_THEPA|nr:uncharacterized protein TpMuguga_03g00865 [Theileria parva strain Muguga]EAN30707.1 hypothetical protein TpMuguga_03g00865 [Theileria parva strain Muguga]|eukprot:XP_762990.1 hypothetical protein [Theileria parva strain Muguga]